jgi:hypothetical protein
MSTRHLIVLGLAVTVLAAGCGGGDDAPPSVATQPPAAAPTTTAAPKATTTTPTRSEAAAQPKIAPKAIAFLDCDSLAKKGAWWTCRRQGGVAYIIEGGTAQSVYDQIRKRSDYNENGSTLHESDGGFIYLPSLDGFDQFLTHVGPAPGMKVVDTDQLS